MKPEGVLARKATVGDLDSVRALANANRPALGFVPGPVLAAGIEHGWLIVAESRGQVVGFVHYRHRKDLQTTLYEICVDETWRRRGVGHLLIRALVAECTTLKKASLRLKCPEDLPANRFYQALGFLLAGKESGKKRVLNIWQVQVDGWGVPPMKFIVSLTMNASDLRQALSLWDESGDPRNPFSRVLISPLFAAPSTLRLVREELRERRNSEVYFDSGGYYVQQGRLTYEELYGRLMDYYGKNQWADRYVLPDWVPTSQDDTQTVDHKVHATITVGRLFHSELPDSLQQKIIPVVQGHTKSQILRCMESYREYAVGLVGFGSFGTGGSNNGMNNVTQQSVQMLRTLTDLARRDRLGVHLFGVSTPPILYLFRQLGITSFDSMAWMKAAGFGNVFLPLTRGYLATYRVAERTHTYEDSFQRLKSLTGHRCPFCERFSVLSSSRMHRIMHNLVSVLDTLDLVNSGRMTHDQILEIIAAGSPTYLRYYGEN